MLINYGYTSGNDGTVCDIIFPCAFPSTIYQVAGSQQGGYNSLDQYKNGWVLREKTATGIPVQNNSNARSYFLYIAIGPG